MTGNGKTSTPASWPQNRPCVIGLTGGIGSGKSAVADGFRDLGITVIDTDLIARELTTPGQPALAEIARILGPEYLAADGSLNRDLLRNHIFMNPAERKKLETILHPRIRAVMRERIDAVDTPYCIAVIPLLLETGQTSEVDRILLVDAGENTQIERVMARDKLSKEAVTAIMQAQASRETRLAAADDVILNDGSLDSLTDKVRALHTRYMELSDVS